MSKDYTNSSLSAQVSEWQRNNEELLANCAEMEWTPPTDLLGSYVSMLLFKESPEDLVVASRLAVQTTSARAQQWTSKVSEWERGFDPVLVKELRERFLGAAALKAVGPEWLVDAQGRWEVAAFSSVSPTHITIGDVSVPYEGMKLPLMKEVDLPHSFAGIGRDSLTHFMWKEKGISAVAAVRPKINGERFCTVRGFKSNEIVGFRTYTAPAVFVPDLMEYYAGQFYVLSPLISAPLTYDLIDRHGFKQTYAFFPHPWMSPHEVAQFPFLYTHKYDGFMIFFDGREVRVKFDPTVEVLEGDEVWEVREESGSLVKVRNRYGKSYVSNPSVLGRLRACVSASELLKLFLVSSVHPPDLLKSVSVNQNASAKVVLLTETGKVVFIREKKSGRLDLIGGILEPGETPLDAIVREISEEVVISGNPWIVSPSSVFHLGVSREEADSVVWTTHLYLAAAPPEILKAEGVEMYAFVSFHDFKHSSLGRPRQVWVAHYLDYLSHTLSTVAQAQTFLCLQGVQKNPPVLPSAWVSKQCLPAYSEQLANYYSKSHVGSESEMAVMLQDSGFFYNAAVTRMAYQRYLEIVAAAFVSRESRILLNPQDPVSRSQLGKLDGYPQDKAGSIDLLGRLFAADTVLPAQDFYKRTHQFGLPSGRRSALKWIDRLVEMKLLKIGANHDGRGRIFEKI